MITNDKNKYYGLRVREIKTKREGTITHVVGELSVDVLFDGDKFSTWISTNKLEEI